MDSEDESDYYEEHDTDNGSASNDDMDDHEDLYTDNEDHVELDNDNGSSSMDDKVAHHSEYDYDDLVHHHSEYDYDDMVDHYIEHGSHTDDMEVMMAHDKDYYDYMPHHDEESHEHRSMSFEDNSERSMLKFPTLKEGPTYYGSSRPEEQLLDTARRLSKIAEGKDFVTEPAVQPFCKENPLPLVSIRKSHQVPNLCFPCL